MGQHRRAPCEQNADGSDRQSGEYPLIRGVESTRDARQLKVRRLGHRVSLAAEHGPASLAHRGHRGEEHAGEPPPLGGFGRPARDQRDDEAGQDGAATGDFDGVHGIAQPEPFRSHGERRGQAMNQQNREARTDPGKSLEEREVAQSETNEAAEEKPREKGARQTHAPDVRKDSQQRRGEEQAPEVRLVAAHVAHGPVGGHGRERKENGGQQRREHGARVLTGCRQVGKKIVKPRQSLSATSRLAQPNGASKR